MDQNVARHYNGNTARCTYTLAARMEIVENEEEDKYLDIYSQEMPAIDPTSTFHDGRECNVRHTGKQQHQHAPFRPRGHSHRPYGASTTPTNISSDEAALAIVSV